MAETKTPAAKKVEKAKISNDIEVKELISDYVIVLESAPEGVEFNHYRSLANVRNGPMKDEKGQIQLGPNDCKTDDQIEEICTAYNKKRESIKRCFIFPEDGIVSDNYISLVPPAVYGFHFEKYMNYLEQETKTRFLVKIPQNVLINAASTSDLTADDEKYLSQKHPALYESFTSQKNHSVKKMGIIDVNKFYQLDMRSTDDMNRESNSIQQRVRTEVGGDEKRTPKLWRYERIIMKYCPTDPRTGQTEDLLTYYCPELADLYIDAMTNFKDFARCEMEGVSVCQGVCRKCHVAWMLLLIDCCWESLC